MTEEAGFLPDAFQNFWASTEEYTDVCSFTRYSLNQIALGAKTDRKSLSSHIQNHSADPQR